MRLSRLRAQRFGQLDQHYASGAKAAWMPTVDISERKDAYVVAVEVPGVGIDDLEITFQDGLLTTRANGTTRTTRPRKGSTGSNAATAPSCARSHCPAT
jgi:HSP20 family molecular chaperone IbpA